MKMSMDEKHTREIVNLKEKYEAMIAELKANAKVIQKLLKSYTGQ